MRAANAHATKTDYYPMVAPSIQNIARRNAMLKRRFPGKRIVCTKRDIESAFRRICIHPEAALIMCTELVDKELGISDDVIVFYLALPFGWNGSPGIFALVGDYIRKVTSGYRPSTPQWESEIPFLVDIFAGDIMLVEPCIGRRPEMVVSSVEWVANQSLGWDAISGKRKR